jgi:hypothetical protein
VRGGGLWSVGEVYRILGYRVSGVVKVCSRGMQECIGIECKVWGVEV